MGLRGENLLGLRAVRGTRAALQGVDPVSGQSLLPAYGGASREQLDQACDLAWRAWAPYRELGAAAHARLLDAIAAHIEDLGEELIDRAALETALDAARLRGERARTTAQLRLFAQLAREGRHVEPRHDPALPGRAPQPRPDLRMGHMGIGPVAVFGASNFPLAFSVAGGDTASALAAGCPVVVKAHNAHPGTSELVGRAVQAAARETGMPDGVFSLLYGADEQIGAWLVAHPRIQAVGFTGSRGGGDALARIAGSRARPIPVFAEMSSVNPVFVFPGALRERAGAIASGFVQSMTLGSGQFCTKPGLVFLLGDEGAQEFVDTLERQLRATRTAPLLSAGIAARYRQATQQAGARASSPSLSAATASDGTRAQVFVLGLREFADDPAWGEEMFGPAAVVVRCANAGELAPLLDGLAGQLTATVVVEAGDHAAARPLMRVLETLAGRLLMNGWPTGVEVCEAMVHGGPYPACSDPRFSSVGTLAIRRFLRPVCYQNMAADLLPGWLHEQKPRAQAPADNEGALA